MDSPRSVYLAIDLGAGSGRLLAAISDGAALTLYEIHRFESPRVDREEGSLWDIDLIWNEIKAGLGKAAEHYGPEAIRGIGVDSWGVDYA